MMAEWEVLTVDNLGSFCYCFCKLYNFFLAFYYFHLNKFHLKLLLLCLLHFYHLWPMCCTIIKYQAIFMVALSNPVFILIFCKRLNF